MKEQDKRLIVIKKKMHLSLSQQLFQDNGQSPNCFKLGWFKEIVIALTVKVASKCCFPNNAQNGQVVFKNK